MFVSILLGFPVANSHAHRGFPSHVKVRRSRQGLTQKYQAQVKEAVAIWPHSVVIGEGRPQATTVFSKVDRNLNFHNKSVKFQMLVTTLKSKITLCLGEIDVSWIPTTGSISCLNIHLTVLPIQIYAM